MNVNLHPGQRVDQGKCVCSACLCCFCSLCNVCYIGAKLHDHRLPGPFLHLRGNCLDRLGILSESNASFFYIRAGNVDLQHIHCFIGKAFHHFAIIFRCPSADIHDDPGVKLLKERDVPLAEYVDSRILQSDGIHHAAFCLRDPRRGISRPWHIGHAFGDNGSQPVKIYEFAILFPGSKGSGCCHDRILKFYTSKINSRIHYNSTSVDKNTGPSLQTRLLCTWLWPSTSLDWHTHARQAPMPQAIRSSKDR